MKHIHIPIFVCYKVGTGDSGSSEWEPSPSLSMRRVSWVPWQKQANTTAACIRQLCGTGDTWHLGSQGACRGSAPDYEEHAGFARNSALVSTGDEYTTQRNKHKASITQGTCAGCKLCLQDIRNQFGTFSLSCKTPRSASIMRFLTPSRA